jgi:hypothetical protein
MAEATDTHTQNICEGASKYRHEGNKFSWFHPNIHTSICMMGYGKEWKRKCCAK